MVISDQLSNNRFYFLKRCLEISMIVLLCVQFVLWAQQTGSTNSRLLHNICANKSPSLRQYCPPNSENKEAVSPVVFFLYLRQMQSPLSDLDTPKI
jgi:hypothetical protein